jgi:hypothetical protein
MIKKITVAIIITTLSVLNSFAQDTMQFFQDSNAFFMSHVYNGLIDYKTIKSNPEILNNLMTQAENIKVSKANAKQYQAFWINAYNLSVVKGITEKYPVKGPLSIQGFFDKTTYALGGIKTTLNDLENKILRAEFPNEARFHFALVCAGLGCPPIINEAYTPAKLETQLQRQATIALNNPNFIKVKRGKVQLSKIFEWYKEDFIHDGSEIQYINQFRKEPIDVKSRISYYDYDWTLNAKK